MSICEPGQQPYQVDDTGGVVQGGASPEAACGALANWYHTHGYGPASVVESSSDSCTWTCTACGSPPFTQPIQSICEAAPSNQVTCAGSCTLTISVTPADAQPEHIADYNELFGMTILVLIGVVCLRMLFNLFNGRLDS